MKHATTLSQEDHPARNGRHTAVTLSHRAGNGGDWYMSDCADVDGQPACGIVREEQSTPAPPFPIVAWLAERSPCCEKHLGPTGRPLHFPDQQKALRLHGFHEEAFRRGDRLDSQSA